jgi:hypothetical protein
MINLLMNFVNQIIKNQMNLENLNKRIISQNKIKTSLNDNTEINIDIDKENNLNNNDLRFSDMFNIKIHNKNNFQ